jgi:hypothetical protein
MGLQLAAPERANVWQQKQQELGGLVVQLEQVAISMHRHLKRLAMA